MMKLFYIIPALIVASVLILISNPFEAEAQTTQQYFIHAKLVVNFEHSANINQVHDYYNSNVRPDLVTLINQYSTNIDNFSYETRSTNDALYIIGINQQNGKNIYEFYPKITFYGTLKDGITQQQFENGFNNFLDDVKQELKTEFQTSGATITKTKIQYTYGSVDEFEP